MQPEIPGAALTTERLHLRQPTLDDLGWYADASADPDVMAHMGGPRDEHLARTHLLSLIGHWAAYGWGPWVVEAADDPVPAGIIGLWRWSLGVELLSMLRTSAQGRGYATESKLAILDYAWKVLDLPTVISLIPVHHTKSLALSARVGLTTTGKLDFMNTEVFLLRIDNPRLTPAHE